MAEASVEHIRNTKLSPTLSIHKWSLTDANDTGQTIHLPAAPDRTVQVFGTFGAGTVVLEGSNDTESPKETAVFGTLHDFAGADLSFTANAIEAVAENPIYIRPRISGSTGAAITVVVTSKGA